MEIFEAGLHRGRPYTEADLDEIVANFSRFGGQESSAGDVSGAVIKPPVVLGHSEDQVLLENSGLPAAGVVSSLWRDGPKLIADFADVPEPIVRLINQRAYRKVSAEFWVDFEDQGRHYGLVLKRVALLGGEVPQIKSLADVPLARLVNDSSRETAVAFCDTTSLSPRRGGQGRSVSAWQDMERTGDMTREQMLELIKSMWAELPPEFLDGLSDEQLTTLLQALGAETTPPAGTEPAGSAGDEPPVTPEDVAAMSAKFADIQRKVVATERMVQARIADEKRRRINDCWGAFVKAGVRTPSQEATTKALLEKCDATQIVAFADGVKSTELDYFAERILKEPPVVTYGDKMAVGGEESGQGGMSPERRKFLASGSPLARQLLISPAKK